MVRRALRCNPNSIDSRAAGIDGLHRLRAECNAGSSGDSSEASRLELGKAKDELEKARAETQQLLRKMEQKRKRIQHLEEENAQLSKAVDERREGIRQPENENEQPRPRTDGLRKEIVYDQVKEPEESSVGKKRKSEDVAKNQKIKKQSGSGSGSGGGNGNDGRSRPIEAQKLDLVQEMHGCLKKMYASVDLSIKHERGTFGCAVKTGNANSPSAPFNEPTKAKFRDEQPTLSARFHKTFSGRGQLNGTMRN